MAHDFYRKAQALHEEFQKRELQYLNAERKWNSMVWKKDQNLPLQEYLKKINKREKETEETYRNLMKQMQELDKHTDLLSLKLEKLGALRNSISHIGTPLWPSGLASSNLSLYGYGATSSLNMKRDFALQDHNSKQVSTQTEIIYCGKCKSQLFVADKSQHFIESENLHRPLSNFQSSVGLERQMMFNQQLFETENLRATSSTPQSYSKQQTAFDKPYLHSFETKHLQSEINHKPILDSSRLNIDSALLNTNPNVAQSMVNTVISEVPVSVNSDKNFTVDPKNGEQATSAPHEANFNSVTLSQQPNYTSEHNLSHMMQSNKHNSLELKDESDDILRNKDEVTDTQPHYILNENIEKSEIRDVEDQSIDASVSKSDVESMNHEFDFLEAETVNINKKSATENKIKIPQSPPNDTNANIKKSGMSDSKQNQQSDLKLKEVSKGMNKISEVTEMHHNKSDTSGAPSPSVHSPNISASDSDSFYGKETPLTATAAYQALLGNTVMPEKKKSQKYSDSESDEVENALANAVRRGSHIPLKSAPEKKDEKPVPHQAESKPANKGSKPPAASKPKSKLSKSTRKVLGLDTSSGSEVELAVKPPVKKIEEDSDEFDFYD